MYHSSHTHTSNLTLQRFIKLADVSIWNTNSITHFMRDKDTHIPPVTRRDETAAGPSMSLRRGVWSSSSLHWPWNCGFSNNIIYTGNTKITSSDLRTALNISVHLSVCPSNLWVQWSRHPQPTLHQKHRRKTADFSLKSITGLLSPVSSHLKHSHQCKRPPSRNLLSFCVTWCREAVPTYHF